MTSDSLIVPIEENSNSPVSETDIKAESGKMSPSSSPPQTTPSSPQPPSIAITNESDA